MGFAPLGLMVTACGHDARAVIPREGNIPLLHTSPVPSLGWWSVADLQVFLNELLVFL